MAEKKIRRPKNRTVSEVKRPSEPENIPGSLPVPSKPDPDASRSCRCGQVTIPETAKVVAVPGSPAIMHRLERYCGPLVPQPRKRNPHADS